MPQSRTRKILIGTFAGSSVRRVVRRVINRYGPSYYEMKKRGFLDYFKGYPKDAIRPEWDDLYGIYTLVMARKPAVIVELGGGYSTFVFAHAAKELGEQGIHVAFHSVDESDHWQNVVKERMPEVLAPYIQYFRATPILTDVGGEEASIFDQLPVDRCNFVYVDGGLAKIRTPGVDALNLERNAPPDFAILVDGRNATVAALTKNLKHRYAITSHVHGRRQTLFARS